VNYPWKEGEVLLKEGSKGMSVISRENALKVMDSIRILVKQEINMPKYLDEGPLDKSSEISEANFQGVSNGFLAELVNALTGYEVEVIGDVEELIPCPCCGSKTLTERFDRMEGTGYEICPYCKWEDDGTTDIHAYRSINKGSLADYRHKLRTNPNKYYRNKWLHGDE
jgi:hypothetical protein